jgi:hypothetical protein
MRHTSTYVSRNPIVAGLAALILGPFILAAFLVLLLGYIIGEAVTLLLGGRR